MLRLRLSVVAASVAHVGLGAARSPAAAQITHLTATVEATVTGAETFEGK